MRYSIITQKCGCHLLIAALLKSIHKHLVPDEIIIEDTKFKECSKSERHGNLMHKQILKTRNDYVLMLDSDAMIFDNGLIEQMYQEVLKPNTFACGTYEGTFSDKSLLVPHCIMLDKKMYLENKIEFDGGGNPCHNAFSTADEKGQKLTKIDGGKRIFHLGQGAKRPYAKLIINNQWRSEFNIFKKITGSEANFNDYVVDDGLDFDDLHQLNNLVLSQLDHKIEYKEPFSLIRLGDLGLRYLESYFNDPTDFVRLGREHADLAIPDGIIGRKLTEELIENMKNADWVDHPATYKGIMQYLYNWRTPLERCTETYTKAGIATYDTNYCSSLQGYLAFIKEFDWSLYRIMAGRRILFVSPRDDLSLLNLRKDLKIAKYGYYQLSMSTDLWERYNAMDAFSKDFNPNDWDLVLVMGSLYGRTIVGRVKKLGGRAFDLGQAIRFNPDHIFNKVVIPIEDQTFYRIETEKISGKPF